MPRIKAKTVVEHRKNQKAALLKVARRLIEKHGVHGFSFGDIADKAMLSRPSVYEYFKNKSDLVIAIIDEEFRPWLAFVDSEMKAANDPRDKIEAFFHSQTKLFKNGQHDLAFILMNSDLSPEVKAKVAEFHMSVLSLLKEPLAAIGYSGSENVLALMGGVLASTIQLAQMGRLSSTKLSQQAAIFALGGLKTLLAREE